MIVRGLVSIPWRLGGWIGGAPGAEAREGVEAASAVELAAAVEVAVGAVTTLGRHHDIDHP